MLKRKINKFKTLKGGILNLIIGLINAINIKKVNYNLKVE
jgi:protoporphyrinogen oxidase